MATCVIKTQHCTLLSRDEYFLFLWFFFWRHKRNQPEFLGCISMRLFVVFIVSGKYVSSLCHFNSFRRNLMTVMDYTQLL